MVAKVTALLVALQAPLLMLAATVLLSATAYMVVRYDTVVWSDTNAAIEALNFSIQTVTTVGYGNWSTGLADGDARIVRLKLVSLPTMIVGAALFALVVAGLTSEEAPVSPAGPVWFRLPAIHARQAKAGLITTLRNTVTAARGRPRRPSAPR